MKLWLDGGLVDADAARIDPTDRGFLIGDGLFETMAVRDGRPLRIAAHMARLRQGLSVLGIDVAMTDDDLANALARVAEANAIATGSLRLTVTRGPAPRGLRLPANPRPTVLITATARPVGPGDPVRAVICDTVRRNDLSPTSRVKSLNYLDGIFALREATSRDTDEAILLNTQGRVTEVTTANLFAVINGAPVTPPIADGVLAGIMRAEIMRRLDAAEQSLVPADLARASECFLTNVHGVRPLVAIDGTPVGDGAAGPVTAGLADLP